MVTYNIYDDKIIKKKVKWKILLTNFAAETKKIIELIKHKTMIGELILAYAVCKGVSDLLSGDNNKKHGKHRRSSSGRFYREQRRQREEQLRHYYTYGY